MSGRKSKSKGARGEREFLNELKKCGIEEAERVGSAQGAGSSLLPDVIHDGFGCEVKYRNRLTLKEVVGAIRQSELSNRGTTVSYAAFRITGASKEHSGWFVAMREHDYITLLLLAAITDTKEKRLKHILSETKRARRIQASATRFMLDDNYYVILEFDSFCEMVMLWRKKRE